MQSTSIWVMNQIFSTSRRTIFRGKGLLQLLVKTAEQILDRSGEDLKRRKQNDGCLSFHPSRRIKVPQNIKRQPIAEAINILNSPISRYRAQILAWNVSQDPSLISRPVSYHPSPEVLVVHHAALNANDMWMKPLTARWLPKELLNTR